MPQRRIKFQFGLRTYAVTVAVCAVLALAGMRYYDSLTGPRIPLGTDPKLSAAMHDAFENPPDDYIAAMPGWPNCTPTQAMRDITAYGDEAIPVLVANLHNHDVYFRLQTYLMLSMIDAKSAVPDLIRALENSEDSDSAILIATLTDITGHPDGYGYYRWYDDERKPEAIEMFREWYSNHSRRHGEKQNNRVHRRTRAERVGHPKP
jgi:hypothetical protein